ncbi:MAG TPA: glycosyltransferase [Leptospiraceae bacterium]|nr:glycosyltransferase [Leptospiraceae bacterium]
MKKKILLFSPPFSGHLHPVLGLGIYLKNTYEIAVVSTSSAMKSIEASGLRGICLLQGKDSFIDEIANPKVQVKNNPVLLYSQLKRNVSLLHTMRKETEELYQTEKPDIVITDGVLPVPGILAESMGIPWFSILASPCVFESVSGVNAYMGGVKPDSTLKGRIRDSIHRIMIKSFKKFMFFLFSDDLRKLGLENVYRKDGSEAVYSHRKVFAMAMSELEFERKTADTLMLTGPILYTPPVNSESPLFNRGKKHILITIGTHLWFEKDRLKEQIRECSLDLNDFIFHFSYGDKNGTVREIQENFHVYSFVSYEEHLFKYDLVLHHCGAGIMYECIRNGIPSIAYPLDYDQFDNAARLETAGACTVLKNIRKLREAVLNAAENENMKKNCVMLQEKFRNYNAPETIENILSEI